MLDRPSDKDYLAFARLARTDDGRVLLSYLARAVETAKNHLVSADSDATIRRLQGRAEALETLAEALEITPDLIRKIEDRARSR